MPHLGMRTMLEVTEASKVIIVNHAYSMTQSRTNRSVEAMSSRSLMSLSVSKRDNLGFG